MARLNGKAGEIRRLKAMVWIECGKSDQEIMRAFAVTRMTVWRWRQRSQGGAEGMKEKASPGRRSRLRKEDFQTIEDIHRRGMVTDRKWNYEKLAAAIRKQFDIKHHTEWIRLVTRRRGLLTHRAKRLLRSPSTQ